MNEVADENADDSWWWYEDDGWYGWEVSQMWHSSDWDQTWYGHTWTESDKPAEEGIGQTEGSSPRVCSVIWSPWFAEMFASEITGLELLHEDSLRGDGSNMHECEAVERDSGRCVGSSRCETGEMFCDCEHCRKESEVFSQVCQLSFFSRLRCELLLSGAVARTKQQKSNFKLQPEHIRAQAMLLGRCARKMLVALKVACRPHQNLETRPRGRVVGMGCLLMGWGGKWGCFAAAASESTTATQQQKG